MLRFLELYLNKYVDDDAKDERKLTSFMFFPHFFLLAFVLAVENDLYLYGNIKFVLK
jgi:hypothetical protein